jgi:hypothetical protein
MTGTDEGEAAEETVVVQREPDAETVVVDRELGAETVVVERAGADRTVVVDRDPAVEGTLAVTRDRAASPGGGPAIPGGRRRRGMTMPPVAPGFGRGAIDAVGPGAVTTYEPRAIPEPPVAPASLPGVAATRTPAPQLPSVARRARRTGMIALGVFAASCVVSVAGLVALGVAVFG